MLDGRCAGQELRGASGSSHLLWPRIPIRQNSRRSVAFQVPQSTDEARIASGRLACTSISCCCANARAAHVVTCPAERLQAVEAARARTTGRSPSYRRTQPPTQQLQRQHDPPQDGPAGPPTDLRRAGTEAAAAGPHASHAAAGNGNGSQGATLGPDGSGVTGGRPQAQSQTRPQPSRSSSSSSSSSRAWPDPPLLTALIGACGSWRDLAALVDEHSVRMNVVHVTAVATRLTRLAPLPPPLPAASAAASPRSAVAASGSGGGSGGLSAASRQQQQPPSPAGELLEWASFVRTVLDLVESREGALDARGIANISWALAKVLPPPPQQQLPPPPPQQQRTQIQTQPATSQAASTAGWGGGGGCASTVAGGANTPPVEQLRSAVKRTVRRLLALPAADPGALWAGRSAMGPQHVANALWAAASLGILAPHGPEAAAEEEEEEDRRVAEGARDWVQRAVAAARGGLRSGAFSEEGVSQLVWSVSEMGLTPDEGWMANLYGAARRKATELSSHSAANVLLSLARMATAAGAAAAAAAKGGDGGGDFDEAANAADVQLDGGVGAAAVSSEVAVFHPPSDAWLFDFLTDTTPTLGSADAVSLSNSAWALAVLVRAGGSSAAQRPAGGAASAPSSPPPPVCWLRNLYAALSQPGALLRCTDAQLGLLLWSLADLSDVRSGGLPAAPPEELLAAAAEELRRRLDSMPDKAFAMASWGLQRLQMRLQQRQQLLRLRQQDQELHQQQQQPEEEEARGEERDASVCQESVAAQQRQQQGLPQQRHPAAAAAAWEAAWLRSAARRMPYMLDRWLLLTLQAAAGWAPADVGEGWLAAATDAVLRPGQAPAEPYSQRHHAQQRRHKAQTTTAVHRKGSGGQDKGRDGARRGKTAAAAATAEQARQYAPERPGSGPSRLMLPRLLQALLLTAEACMPRGRCPIFVTEAVAAAVLAAAANCSDTGGGDADATGGSEGKGRRRSGRDGGTAAAGTGADARVSLPWSATELLRCGAALGRIGYVPSPAWRQAFFGRVLQLAEVTLPPPQPPPPSSASAGTAIAGEASEPEAGTASRQGQGHGQGQEPRQKLRRGHQLSGSDVALLLSCSQRWAATPSEATLTALLYGVPYEAWSPRSAAWACRLLALQQLQQQQAQQAQRAQQQQQQKAQAREVRQPDEAGNALAGSDDGTAQGQGGDSDGVMDAQSEAAPALARQTDPEVGSASQPSDALIDGRGRQPPPPPLALNGSAVAPVTRGSLSSPVAQTADPGESGLPAATRSGWSSTDLNSSGLDLGQDSDLGLGLDDPAAAPAVARTPDVLLLAPRPRPSEASGLSSPPSPSRSAATSPLASLEAGSDAPVLPLNGGGRPLAEDGLPLGATDGSGGRDDVVLVTAAAAAVTQGAELLSYSPGADGAGARREEVLQRGPGRPAASGQLGMPAAAAAAFPPVGAAAAAARGPVTVAAAAATPAASPRPAWSPAAAAAAAAVVSYVNTWPVDSSGSDGDAATAAAAGAAVDSLARSEGVYGRSGGGVAVNGFGSYPPLGGSTLATGGPGGVAVVIPGGVAALGLGTRSVPGPGPAGPGASAAPPSRQAPALAPGRAAPPSPVPPQPQPLPPPAQRFILQVLGSACASLERQHAHRLEASGPPPPAPPPRAQQGSPTAAGAALRGPAGATADAAPTAAAPSPTVAAAAAAALDGRWSPLSLSQLLWSAARLRLRPTTRQREVLQAALTALLMRWSALPPYVLVPLLWSCRRLGVPLGRGPAALLRRALLLHPGLQPGALADGELFMVLEALVGWRMDPPTEWSRQVPRRLALWLGRTSPAVAATTAASSTFKWRLTAAATAAAEAGRRPTAAAAAAARRQAEGGDGDASSSSSGVEARQLLMIMRALRRLQIAARSDAAAGATGARPPRPHGFRLRLPPVWAPSWAPVVPSKAARRGPAGVRSAAAAAAASSTGTQLTPLDAELWPELWPMLRTAVRQRLAEVFGLRPAAGGQTAVPPPPPRERLAALMCGAACGLVDWEAWGVAALRRLAGELPPRDYHAWLALAAGLQFRVTRGSLEDLLLAWCLATGPHLDVMQPTQLHATLRLAGRVAETLRRPMPWEWVSAAVRRYSRCVGALPPAQLAQVPAVLRRLRRVPPPQWQMSYADLVVRRALSHMSGPRAQAMLRGAAALSPGLAALLRGPVHEHMTALWVREEGLWRRRRQLAAKRQAEQRRRRVRLRLRPRAG